MPIRELRVYRSSIDKDRLDVLRDADAIVREFSLATGFENQVWQMPVVLLPIGGDERRESIVLRPINSVDGMTADVVLMEPKALDTLTAKLLELPSIAAVFYDCTHKPPGTIEWE
jgi:GMP synthase (glutamine-hydrolysing)